MEDTPISRVDPRVVIREIFHPIRAREHYFRYYIVLSLAKEIRKEITILTGGYSTNRKWNENVQNFWNDAVEHSSNICEKEYFLDCWLKKYRIHVPHIETIHSSNLDWRLVFHDEEFSKAIARLVISNPPRLYPQGQYCKHQQF